MVEDKQNKKKWKDNLLKSSLPLEQVVSEKLTQQGFSMSGEFTYMRQNEHNTEVEFSVDLYALRELTKSRTRNDTKPWGTENILIECKYSHPHVNWIFSQYAEYVNTSFVNCLEFPYRPSLKDDPLYKLDHQFRHCVRGIELMDDHFNPDAISRGLHQLRYAYPNLVKQEIIRIENPSSEPRPVISYMYMVLVTNAPLYVLKTQQDLEKYHAAESLDDIAQKVSALVVSQEAGPDLVQYQDKILSDELERMLNPTFSNDDDETIDPEAVFYPSDFINSTLKRSAILVVNMNRLDAALKKVAQAIYDAE